MRRDHPISPFAGEPPTRDLAEAIARRTPIPRQELALIEGYERRIRRAMWWLSAVGIAAFWVWRGWSWAAGFAAGAILSGLNFHWIKSAVNVITDAVTSQARATAQEGSPPPKTSQGYAIARFIFRYALIGLVGYTIFLSSVVSLTAFLAGLFLAIAALMAEAAYQVIHDLNQSFRTK